MRGGGAAQRPLALEYPMSLRVYDSYLDAQRAVDFLSDNQFPVQNLAIVGTDLRQVERVIGRLTRTRFAAGGAVTGGWFGLFVGMLFWLAGGEDASFGIVILGLIFGAAFGFLWGLLGYQATGGARDFTSVTQILALKYEVLCEHRVADQAREILARMPGENPFA
jgi:hypothetical protein